MLPNGAGGEHLVTFDENLTDGRKVKGVDDLQAGAELPAEKKDRDADNAEPLADEFTSALPKPVGGQWIGLVDRYQVDGFLFLSCRAALL